PNIDIKGKAYKSQMISIPDRGEGLRYYPGYPIEIAVMDCGNPPLSAGLSTTIARPPVRFPARCTATPRGGAGHCALRPPRIVTAYCGVSGARQRSGGVEKYSSIASRQAPEHGSTATSPGLDSMISAAVFSAQLMQTPARSIPQPVQLPLDL